MAVTCPPHEWEVKWQAADYVYLAHCKKCGRRRTFPLPTNGKEGTAVPVSKKVTSG